MINCFSTYNVKLSPLLDSYWTHVPVNNTPTSRTLPYLASCSPFLRFINFLSFTHVGYFICMLPKLNALTNIHVSHIYIYKPNSVIIRSLNWQMFVLTSTGFVYIYIYIFTISVLLRKNTHVRSYICIYHIHYIVAVMLSRKS